MKSLLLILASLIAMPAFAKPIFGTKVKMVGYKVSGNGCPSGSVSVVLSPDGSEFSIIYDKLSIEVGPGKPTAYANCEVDISVNKPILMGFRVKRADFRGFVSLSPGVKAEQDVKLSAGLGKVRDITADFGSQKWYGPVQENYVLSVENKNSALDVLACVPPNKKSHIVVKTKIKMEQSRNPSSQGLLAVDTADGKLVQRYSLEWENCADAIGGILGGLFGGR